jgi:hypothetical protein
MTQCDLFSFCSGLTSAHTSLRRAQGKLRLSMSGNGQFDRKKPLTTGGRHDIMKRHCIDKETLRPAALVSSSNPAA